MTESGHFDASDFASEMPETLGRGNRPSNPTPGMLNHQTMLQKNADASRKRAQMTAQRQAIALAGQSAATVQATQATPAAQQPSVPNSFGTMDFQPFQPTFQGYNPLAGGYFSPNPMLWNMGTGQLPPTPSGLYTNTTAMPMLSQDTDSDFRIDDRGKAFDQDTANEVSSDPHANDDDTFAAGLGTLPVLGSMSDIHSTPVRLPGSQPLRRVQSNGLTPTLMRPARNLQYCSHAEEPAGSSPWAGNKENVSITPPELASIFHAQIASSLGKRNTELATDDSPIEVPADNTSEDAEEESIVDAKPKKKKQKVSARSLQLTSACQRILNGSYPHFRFLLITTNPWMDDKDNAADEAALKAWFTQLDYLIANAGY
ncbi:hypothetical protein EV421DRAFT_1903965 [Armillaria borealis]|uniref:Uncharacterized protein n=1 Tax=Armillaria borealis TaxID=47425 RepID=A0AA39JJQ6_9AGAR|nr:hypothetical protein EV421DRAFT_1903965 [Armillaria borealis]